MKFYKIQDTDSGLFSRGGEYCDTNPRRWSKKGKVWGQLSWLKSHLKLYVTSRYNKKLSKWVYDNYIPETWEVIEYSTEGEKRFKAKDFYPNEIPS